MINEPSSLESPGRNQGKIFFWLKGNVKQFDFATPSGGEKVCYLPRE